MQGSPTMNKLISANYWFGCDWWFYEVGYLGMRAGQLSLACAGVYLWNTGHCWVTRLRINSGIQHILTQRIERTRVPSGQNKSDDPMQSIRG